MPIDSNTNKDFVPSDPYTIEDFVPSDPYTTEDLLALKSCTGIFKGI